MYPINELESMNWNPMKYIWVSSMPEDILSCEITYFCLQFMSLEFQARDIEIIFFLASFPLADWFFTQAGITNFWSNEIVTRIVGEIIGWIGMTVSDSFIHSICWTETKRTISEHVLQL